MGALKVSSQSNPNAVAGAIAVVVRDSGSAAIQVIGAGALNQAMKAVAIARGFLSTEGLDLVVAPSFAEVEIEGRARTAIRLIVADRYATATDEEVTVATAERSPLATPPLA